VGDSEFMINLKELKQLAEKATMNSQTKYPHAMSDDDAQFIAACNPTQVIQLIESLELAVEALDRIEGHTRGFGFQAEWAAFCLNQIKDKVGLE
jgi:hypothetical protein